MLARMTDAYSDVVVVVASAAAAAAAGSSGLFSSKSGSSLFGKHI